LHREVGRLGTLEDAVDIPGRLSRLFGIIAAIADQPTRLRTIGGKIDRRNAVSRRQLDDQLAIGGVEKRSLARQCRPGIARLCRDNAFDLIPRMNGN
jgi:hypothetical protein